ncbi:MAG: M16 family metallopeptidase [Archangium sp.]
MKRLIVIALCASACATTKSAPKDAANVELEKVVAPPTNPVAAVALPTVEPMKLVLQPVANKPVVSVRLVFRTGSVDDPAGKEGLSALTTRVLLEGGTKSLDSAQVLEALYPMAAELSGDTDKEFTTIAARVHRDRLPRLLEILSEALTAPRFDAREFERLKGEQLTTLKSRLRQENDEELSKAALDALLFDGHPYRHAVVGTEAGLNAITLDDVKMHWQRTFSQDRLIIGLAGAVDDALAKTVKQSLAPLPATGAVRATLPTATGPMGSGVIVKRDTSSTAGAFGFVSPLRRGDADFIDLFIALSYFGEHRQEHGVLFQEVRDRRGLNYGTYAYAQHYRQDGWESVPRPNTLRTQQDVMIWLRPVVSANAVFATRAVVHFLEQARTKPIPQDRFDTARGFLGGATRVWTLTDQRRLGWAIDDVISGTPDFLEAVRQRLATITPADAQAALRKYVRPEVLNFAFVTRDAASLAAAITSSEPTKIAYPAPKPDDVLADDQRISTTSIPLAADRLKSIDASEFLAK